MLSVMISFMIYIYEINSSVIYLLLVVHFYAGQVYKSLKPF